MKNILLLTKRFNVVKEVLNSLSSNFCNEIKLYKIAYTKSDIYKILINEYKYIDLIILDYELNKNFIFEIISNLNDLKYYKSIIVINTQGIVLDRYKYYIYNSLNNIKIDSISKIIYSYLSTTNNNSTENIIKNKIFEQLKILKFNSNHLGTKYLLESIWEIYKKKYIQFNLKRDIFPIISRKYNKSINTIKGNVTQACNFMIKNCDKQFICKYFGYFEYYKPTVKQIIETILEKI